MCRAGSAADMQRSSWHGRRQGDHEAFIRLVDGSVRPTVPVANLILRDSDRAQDAVQEALVWPGESCDPRPGRVGCLAYRLTV